MHCQKRYHYADKSEKQRYSEKDECCTFFCKSKIQKSVVKMSSVCRKWVFIRNYAPYKALGCIEYRYTEDKKDRDGANYALRLESKL